MSSVLRRSDRRGDESDWEKNVISDKKGRSRVAEKENGGWGGDSDVIVEGFSVKVVDVVDDVISPLS